MREAAGFIIFFSDGQHEISTICAVCQKLARKKKQKHPMIRKVTARVDEPSSRDEN